MLQVRVANIIRNLSEKYISSAMSAIINSKIESVRLAYTIYTETDVDSKIPPFLIMHGLFGGKKNWHSIGSKLQKSLNPKRKIIVVDARNHGDSPHSQNHSNAHLAQDIVELLKELSIPKASFLGHSMGGRAMIYLALAYPQLVEHLIIGDTGMSAPPVANQLSDTIKTIKFVQLPSPTLSKTEGRQQVEKELIKTLHPAFAAFLLLNLQKLKNGEFVWTFNINAIEEYAKNATDYSNVNMKQFSGAVLLIAAKDQKFVTPEHVTEMRNSFPNLMVKWTDSGHLFHIQNPDELIMFISDFLK